MTNKYSHYEKIKVTGELGLSGKSPKATKLHMTQGAGNTEQGAEEPAANTAAPAACT